MTPAGRRDGADAADAQNVAKYVAHMDGSSGYLLHEALRVVSAMVARANEFVQSTAPWALAKDSAKSQQLDDTLASLSRQIARQCVLFTPFMPSKAQAAWAQIGGAGQVADQRVSSLPDLDTAGWRVAKGEPLFPRPIPRDP